MDVIRAKFLAVTECVCRNCPHLRCLVEGSEECDSVGKFVDTGLTATKYVPQLLVTFDVLPDKINITDSANAATDCAESYRTLQRSVCQYIQHIIYTQ